MQVPKRLILGSSGVLWCQVANLTTFLVNGKCARSSSVDRSLLFRLAILPKLGCIMDCVLGCVISRILGHLSMVDAEKIRCPWLVRDKLGRVYGSSGSIKSLRSLGFDMSHSDLLLGYSWVLGKDLIYRRSFSSLNLPVLRVHVILGTATGFKMAV